MNYTIRDRAKGKLNKSPIVAKTPAKGQILIDKGGKGLILVPHSFYDEFGVGEVEDYFSVIPVTNALYRRMLEGLRSRGELDE